MRAESGFGPLPTTTAFAMRQLLEPQLVNDPFGDPGLFVDLRDERRALLFDLGDITPLPPRKLLRLSHVFVSHTHMDHFAGFDALLRVLLGRKPRLVLTGGPGFVAQVEHKLRAYSWNVVQRYEVPLALEVHEVAVEGPGRSARFSSRGGFELEPLGPFEPAGDLLHDDPLLRVRGRFVDHGIPCLAFVVEEKARVKVAKDRLAALGIATGPWLRTLRLAVLAGAGADTPIDLHWRDRAGEHRSTRPLGELVDVVLSVAPGRRIGYATDLCFTAANRRTLLELMRGVDQLFIEAVFLEADADHARRKNHLTARQAGEIAHGAGARELVPFHFSPRYQGRDAALLDEALAAHRGGGSPAAGQPSDPSTGPPADQGAGTPGSRACSRAML